MPSQEEPINNPSDNLKEVERCLSAAYRSLQRRDFITPTSEELSQIQAQLLGKQCRCPKNINDFYLDQTRYIQSLESAGLHIVVTAMPAATSRSHPGALIEIAARRTADPEHLQLALAKFPYVLGDENGREYLPHHRKGGSLYFYGLHSDRCYTFRVLETK